MPKQKKGRKVTPDNILRDYATPETETKNKRKARLKNKRNAKYRHYQNLGGPSTRTRSRTEKVSARTRSKKSARLRQQEYRASLSAKKKKIN